MSRREKAIQKLELELLTAQENHRRALDDVRIFLLKFVFRWPNLKSLQMPQSRMETVSNLSMYQIGSFSRLSSASLGVRQAVVLSWINISTPQKRDGGGWQSQEIPPYPCSNTLALVLVQCNPFIDHETWRHHPAVRGRSGGQQETAEGCDWRGN